MAAERERIQRDQGGPAVTISLSAIGETSEAQLDEDSFHMLWLVHRNRRNKRARANPSLGCPADRVAHCARVT
jgi:hypothetical protein